MKSLRIADDKGGLTTTCPGCGEAVEVPAAPPREADDDDGFGRQYADADATPTASPLESPPRATAPPADPSPTSSPTPSPTPLPMMRPVPPGGYPMPAHAARSCPMCGAQVPPQAYRCPQCGEGLGPPPSVPPPGPYYGSYYRPHRGGMILAFSIIAWVMGVVIGPIFSIIALVMANADLREIAAGRMDPSGEGLTRSGKIISIIHLAFSGVVIVFVIAFVIIMIASEA